MFDISAIIWLPIVIYSVILHEIAHGWMAYRLGDATAARAGRLTLNPVAHIDPVMTILVPLLTFVSSHGHAIFGGAKPVPVNPYAMRDPRRGMMLVGLAGPLVNFAIALTLAVPIRLMHLQGLSGNFLFAGLFMAAFWNVLLGVFNLMPIPPLDGSRVLAGVLPWRFARIIDMLERFGMLIVVFVVFMTPAFRYLLYVAKWIAEYMGLPVEWLRET